MDTQKMKVQKLVPTEYDGKWGFIDAATGEEVVPFIYDYAHAFSVGLALVSVVAGGLFRRHPGHHAAGSGAVLRPAGVRHHPRARQRGQLHAHRGRAVRHGLRLLFRAAPPQTPPLTHPARPQPPAPQHRKASLHQPGRRGQDLSCLFCAPDCTRGTNVLY